MATESTLVVMANLTEAKVMQGSIQLLAMFDPIDLARDSTLPEPRRLLRSLLVALV